MLDCLTLRSRCIYASRRLMRKEVQSVELIEVTRTTVGAVAPGVFLFPTHLSQSTRRTL